MRLIALSFLFAAVLGGTAAAAPASEVACRGDGTRVALLIGNQDYVGTMQPLDNPRRDIAVFGALLCQHGFTVFRHADLDVASFDSTVESFARAARGTKTALVYYSGHGFAVGRRNWLVPVDARLGCEDISGDGSDVTRLKRRLIDLDEDVLSRLDGAGDQIVILDACRTDPVKGCRGGATPSLVKGLVRASASSARLIVYATQDGQVALDRIRGSETSPLIGAMLKRLPENPRRDWLTAMAEVSREVFALTDRKQRPNIDFSIAPQGCLALDCGATAQPAPGATDADVRRDYELAERADTQEAWDAFLARHPSGFYADLARAQRNKRAIAVLPVPPAATPPTPVQPAVVAPPAPPATPPTPVQPAVVAPPAPPATPPTPIEPAVGIPSTITVNPLSPERERALKPKDSFVECDACPEMVVTPAGSFTMGSPASEKERESDEGPQRRVTFAQQFAVGKFAVTVDQFAAFVRETGHGTGGLPIPPPDAECIVGEIYRVKRSGHSWHNPGFPQSGSHPAVCISWDDAKAYVAWLSGKTGKTYRLLSEAEREYVARAGRTTPFWWGSTISTSQANYDGSWTYPRKGEYIMDGKGEDRRKTVPVDSFQPNPWGLYQVHGNVHEWTEDCWNARYRGAPTDGSAWTAGDCSKRAIRGGSWPATPSRLRAAARFGNSTIDRDDGIGFRVARTLTP